MENTIDKSWTKFLRFSDEYKDGLKAFIENAKKYARHPDKMICPCAKCKNCSTKSHEDVFEDLVVDGFDPLYKEWVLHGENPIYPSTFEENADKEMSDAYRMYQDTFFINENCPKFTEGSRYKDFIGDFEEAETPLYSTCSKYTKLSAVIALYNHKARNNLSDKSFNELLQIIRNMLPEDNTLPESLYAVRKFLKEFNLEYEKIDACVNDCCLFRKENEHLEECPTCGVSRWKVHESTNKPRKGVSAKVLRYFPIIPRLRRMFVLEEKAEQMRWHYSHRSQDGKMRHPVDSFAWNTINNKWPNFASDPRNLRLGLATDGFNPFNSLSSRYSCWPVILVIYNFPPHICMSHENMMLTLLIPGPSQPGNDIDIYLQPLIDDLKELWDVGVDVFDGFTKTMFNLKAILMWTINDFPAYGNLAGCTTKGEFACPVCGPEVCSLRLRYSGKHVYQGHRRFLPQHHRWRKNSKSFNGTEEHRRPPRPLSGKDISLTLNGVINVWGKAQKKRKKSVGSMKIWKKKSIFFNLPYWEELDLRHNLDVMHIEKNVCESLISTLLDIKGRSKDGLKSRLDLEDLKIRKELHPQKKGDQHYLPPGPYLLSKTERLLFCKRLRALKLPDGYGSNIRNCVSVNECKILGFKSHDYHMMMQQLLSTFIRGTLPKKVRVTIFRLCSFFNEICQRVVDKNKIETVEDEIVETLCMLEMYFPPSFFDIMIHLTIHIGREVRICGPVQYRWMYPFERYMKVLKSYVRNHAHPEGCIAECYLVDESIRYFREHVNLDAQSNNKSSRNEEYDDDTILEGRPLSTGKPKTFSDEMLKIVHKYVLFNMAEVEPFLKMHLEELKQKDRRLLRDANTLQKMHSETFSTWLLEKIKNNHPSTVTISDMLKSIAEGPRRYFMSYSGYLVNGKRYHTIDVERSTQDCGVSVVAETICRSSAKDTTQVVANISYYGIVKDIILLDYHSFRLPIFQCNWANISGGVKEDEGFTLVNLHEGVNQFQRDPFILASQAKQVFYSRENESSNWYVVLKAPPRGCFDLEEIDESIYTIYAPQDLSKLDDILDTNDSEYCVRDDCEGTLV